MIEKDEVVPGASDLIQAAFIVHLLSLMSFLNAAYTFLRKRHYRLFEQSVDTPPGTPSAHRVRVDSSPLSSSPLRFLQNMIASTTADARAHPDAARDVWEIAIWDPTLLCLRMFCLFSPGHVLVYFLFLPTAPQDPRPSITVVTTIVLAALLSIQLLLLQSNFTQRSTDTSVIQKGVLHEYDIKYVHPRTQPLVRDVGTQYSATATSAFDLPEHESETNTVETYQPTIIINRGFHTKPNANYLNHIDPDGLDRRLSKHVSHGLSSSTTIPNLKTPTHLRDLSSPLRPRTAIRQPQFRPSVVSTDVSSRGDGGSLGVYAHANSPLRKSASTNFPVTRHDRDRSTSPVKPGWDRGGEREASPLKRSSVPAGLHGALGGQRWSHLQGTPARRESGRF